MAQGEKLLAAESWLAAVRLFGLDASHDVSLNDLPFNVVASFAGS
ncbi:MAG: hypothetical protein WCH75_24160 [Candidatus Binatia bacterium]